MPAIAALFVIIPALVLLLFAFVNWHGIGSWLSAQVDQFLRGVPIVGDQIHGAIVWIGDRLGSLFTGWSVPALQPLIDFIDVVVGIPTWIVRTAAGAATWAWVQIVAAAYAIAQLSGWVHGQVAGLQIRAAAQAVQLAQHGTRLDAEAAGQTYLRTVAIPAAAASAYTGAVAWASSALAAEKAARAEGIRGAELTAAAITAAEAAARAAADAGLDRAAKLEAAAVRQAAHAEAASLAATVAAGITDLEGQLHGVLEQIGPIAAGTTIAATLTATLTELERLRQCATPVCDYLGPELDLLSLIGNTATVGLLLALVGSAVRDPQGTAADVQALAGPFVAAAAGTVGELTGARV